MNWARVDWDRVNWRAYLVTFVAGTSIFTIIGLLCPYFTIKVLPTIMVVGGNSIMLSIVCFLVSGIAMCPDNEIDWLIIDIRNKAILLLFPLTTVGGMAFLALTLIEGV